MLQPPSAQRVPQRFSAQFEVEAINAESVAGGHEESQAEAIDVASFSEAGHAEAEHGI